MSAEIRSMLMLPIIRSKKGFELNMEKTRFVRVVRIAVEHYEDTEKIVNQSIRQLHENGAKIISIQVLGIPFLMYNVIYEAETEISETAVPETSEIAAEQDKTKAEICTDNKSDNAETADTNTEQGSGEQHGTDESAEEKNA